MTVTTAGGYVRKRREAAEREPSDAPAGLSAPIEAIEADNAVITYSDAEILASWLELDLGILQALAEGCEVPDRFCRECACSEWAPCIDDLDGVGTCYWVARDLCSRCATVPA